MAHVKVDTDKMKGDGGATLHMQQSIDALGTSLTQISRSIDRLTDEQRRLALSRKSTTSQSSKRARDDDDKENDRVLKSAVTKKNSSVSSHRRT